MKEGREFNLYKGLQKPLVFKYFKGKFIYWGVGSILFGLVSCMVLASAVNIGVGILALIVILGGGLGYTAFMQNKGLHSKTKNNGVFIIPSTYYRNGQKSKGF